MANPGGLEVTWYLITEKGRRYREENGTPID